ncbi:YIP1 family protein [Deinococcus malanensis]|uniref:YIP1 family protein n=1 Tax=Deinococcus malanensis TaxID=1706855 RepID=A0ABQ2ETS5_9DEIO|nr:YIP1 family protein [Deinococcus malanensis]GGK21756.1 YIP1 family protein [Deinococcus malanensis]
MSKPTRYQTAEVKATITDMFAQSSAVLARPGPATFERFERRGGTRHALVYVGLAAVVSALIAAFFAIFHTDVTVIGQLISRLILIPAQFLIFTGAVYLIGRKLFKGTGTYPEVAYTFALFFVPLTILGTLIGIVPVLGWLLALLISLVMVAFGYFAVQSSMNLRDQGSAVITLVLAGVAHWLLGSVVGGLLTALFYGG